MFPNENIPQPVEFQGRTVSRIVSSRPHTRRLGVCLEQTLSSLFAAGVSFSYKIRTVKYFLQLEFSQIKVKVPALALRSTCVYVAFDFIE